MLRFLNYKQISNSKNSEKLIDRLGHEKPKEIFRVCENISKNFQILDSSRKMKKIFKQCLNTFQKVYTKKLIHDGCISHFFEGFLKTCLNIGYFVVRKFQIF